MMSTLLPTDASGPRLGITPEVVEGARAYLYCEYRDQSPDDWLATAWETFYCLCDSVLRRFILARGVPREELEDCLQDIWIEVITSLRDFQYDPARGKFESWLYSVVRSKVIDLIRRRKRYAAQRLTSAVAERLIDRVGTCTTEQERQSELEWMQSALARLRDQVSECNYDIAEKRWLNELRVEEIATCLQLTKEQVCYRLYRMKRKLARLLGDEA